MTRNSKLLYYSAAACTFIAGILHLTLVPNAIDRNVNNGIFFLIGGLAQIFWVVPMIRQWGRGWYYVGLAGTLVFVVMWVITRLPGNPYHWKSRRDRRYCDCGRSIPSCLYCPNRNYIKQASKSHQK